MAKVQQNTIKGVDTSNYSRTYTPESRWGDGWELFWGCLSKHVTINVFTLLFLVPSIAIVYIGYAYTHGLGSVYPFSSNVGLGYFSYPDVVGLSESVYLSSDIMFYSLLVLSMVTASIGISGGLYATRKLINTHGEFEIKDFFRGVKVAYFNVLLPLIVFCALFFLCVISTDWVALLKAQGESTTWAKVAQVCIITITCIVGLFFAWMLAVGVSYKCEVKYLFKNSFVLFIGTMVQSVIMAAVALAPAWLMWWFASNTFMFTVMCIVCIFFGMSYIFLVWMEYTQWVFDAYINPQMKKEKEIEKAKKTPKEIAQEEAEERKQILMELLASGRSELIGKPIKPIDAENKSIRPVGVAYSRSEISRVKNERKMLKFDIQKYELEHKDDALYRDYNRLFDEREKALQGEKKGKKAKKKSSTTSNTLLGRGE